MSVAYVGFGANLGDPADVYRRAAERLASDARVDRLRSSPLFRTAPAGGPTGQDAYLNGCFEVITDLDPIRLFRILRSIEDEFGRDRSVRWSARTLDLDLLLHGNEVIASNVEGLGPLLVPHPRMHYRAFALRPLAELNPQVGHPILKMSVDSLSRRISSADLVLALVGGSDRLATRTAEAFGAERPSSRVARIRPDGLDLETVDLGSFVIGVGTCGLASSGIDGARSLVVLADATTASNDVAADLLPVADCRDDCPETVVGRVEAVLASLRPPIERYDSASKS